MSISGTSGFILSAAACAIVLSGCGSSSGTTPQSMMKQPPATMQPPATTQPPAPPGGGGQNGGTNFTQPQLQGDLAAAARLADAEPRFGSIVQSSNAESGVTSDAVDTALTVDAAGNGVLSMTVTNGAGEESLSLNGREHLHTDLTGTAWMSDQDLPEGWSGNGAILAKRDGTATTVAFVYTAWEDADSTNYLAGGYWVTGSDDGSGGVDYEIGTFGDFGDGSVFNHGSDGWTKPASGTATYAGAAEGTYHAAGGSGVWWGGLTLAADFAGGTINGCVGCSTDPEERIYTYETIAELKADDGTLESGTIRLGEASITDDGTFKGAVSVTGPGVTTSSGNWGGTFSDNDAVDTTPARAAGTLGGKYTDAEGNGAFAGVFVGDKQ